MNGWGRGPRPTDLLAVSSSPYDHLNPSPAPSTAGPAGTTRQPRPWLAVRWRCCSTYSRIYRHPNATEYAGGCPRCGKPVRVKVGPGGTGNRFFEAG